MATKYLLSNEDNLGEIDELEDSEVPEMGEEGILTPENPKEMEFDDTESEEVPEAMEEE
ncbi:MAG: hypothetical protein NT078_01610 [Candidatus Azambacteria bacterium]|nr:hypothetical protein [Candidatus Azambacteria bacterium]